MYKLFFLIALVFCNLSVYAQSASVLRSNKKMKFEVKYTDSIQKIQILDTVLLEITNKPWRYDSLRQRIVVWTRHTNKISSANKTKVFSLGNSRIDSASVFETETEYWLTLPRNHYFAILQIAPPVRFVKGARVNDTYSSLVEIGKGWGIYENMNLENVYHAERRAALKVKDKYYPYLQIDAVGTCKFGKNLGSYLWNEELGFIAADFRFYNGVKLAMKLIAIEY